MVAATPEPDWRPAAPLESLKRRAAVLATIREFFAARDVLEVETPVLSATTTPDCHLDSMETVYTGPLAPQGQRLYLQTSPEFAMKRLLAAGSGPIYQLGKVFRDGEFGQWHNPEFTMLEWYRPGFSYVELMDEVAALVGTVLGSGDVIRITYSDAFQQHARIEPLFTSIKQLKDKARTAGYVPAIDSDDRDMWLDLLMSHVVGPKLGCDAPTFIYDFPASQGMLARTKPDNPALAERFELYIKGVEIANGYQEMVDATDVQVRLVAQQYKRRQTGRPPIALDDRLLAALNEPLSTCAGVALGVDRLVMLATAAISVSDVIAFPLVRA